MHTPMYISMEYHIPNLQSRKGLQSGSALYHKDSLFLHQTPGGLLGLLRTGQNTGVVLCCVPQYVDLPENIVPFLRPAVCLAMFNTHVTIQIKKTKTHEGDNSLCMSPREFLERVEVGVSLCTGFLD